MISRRSRILWCCASAILASAFAAHVWFGERVRRPVADPYYFWLESVIPLAFVAAWGAGAVLLARRVGLGGRWYWAPQLAAVAVGALKLGVAAAGPPYSSVRSRHSILLADGGTRSGLIGLAVLTYAALLVTSTGCMYLAVKHQAQHRPELDEQADGR